MSHTDHFVTLNPTLTAALDSFSSTRPLLLASDFDGVLAPLVDNPKDSRMQEESAAALARITGQDGITVALVSGRAIADLHALAHPQPGTILIGSHGAERGHVNTDGSLHHDETPLPDSAQERLEALEDYAEALAATTRGAWIEHKPTAVVLHTRLADPDEAQRVNQALHSWAHDSRLHVMTGHNVVEVSVLKATKGDAVTALRHELQARSVLYLGDDVTDETVFATLGSSDVSIKVGSGDTRAVHRVNSPQEVSFTLTHIADRVNADH